MFVSFPNEIVTDYQVIICVMGGWDNSGGKMKQTKNIRISGGSDHVTSYVCMYESHLELKIPKRVNVFQERSSGLKRD